MTTQSYTEQTTTRPSITDRTACAECGVTIPRAVDAAYDDLYGTVIWRPITPARLIASALTMDPARSDADILAAALPTFFDHEPAALVAAVRHRQTETAA